MSQYTPDRWVILEFITPEETIQKVFAGWYGGFAGSDSWQLNSGITNVRIDGIHYEFDSYSGSTYFCHHNSYGMTSLQNSILANWKQKAKDAGLVNIRILDLDEVVVS